MKREYGNLQRNESKIFAEEFYLTNKCFLVLTMRSGVAKSTSILLDLKCS